VTLDNFPTPANASTRAREQATEDDSLVSSITPPSHRLPMLQRTCSLTLCSCSRAAKATPCNLPFVGTASTSPSITIQLACLAAWLPEFLLPPTCKAPRLSRLGIYCCETQLAILQLQSNMIQPETARANGESDHLT
jgi:hypothetical protein